MRGDAAAVPWLDGNVDSANDGEGGGAAGGGAHGAHGAAAFRHVRGAARRAL